MYPYLRLLLLQITLFLWRHLRMVISMFHQMVMAPWGVIRSEGESCVCEIQMAMGVQTKLKNL